MSGRDRIRRGWTHRRLGIGAEQIGEHALAETEALLTRVGARGTTTSAFLEADPFSTALLDYACDIDRTAGIAAVDAIPVASELLRLTPVDGHPRRPTWRVMLPALSGSLAAVVVVLTLLLGRTSTAPVMPSLSVTAESQQLLRHANTLLAAAASAAPAQRTRLVTEAKADLTHVTRLLPLAPPPARSGLRQRLHALNRQMRPLAPPPQRATSGGAATGSRSGSGGGSGDGDNDSRTSTGSGAGTGTPLRQQPPRRRPPAQGVDTTSSTVSGSQATPPDTIRPPRPGTGTGTGTAVPPQLGGQSDPSHLPPRTGPTAQQPAGAV
ncbi:MAG TPA: hypothetical protein VHV76_16565 [Mycobacteriales bacterium]|nr:hypothetical protein [Mycobacteriales bacterium]